MIADNDCEDQGFTRIEDGCYHCLPTFVGGKPVRTPMVRVERFGHWYWQCPKCLGYYGPAPLAPSRSTTSGDGKSL